MKIRPKSKMTQEEFRKGDREDQEGSCETLCKSQVDRFNDILIYEQNCNLLRVAEIVKGAVLSETTTGTCFVTIGVISARGPFDIGVSDQDLLKKSI